MDKIAEILETKNPDKSHPWYTQDNVDYYFV